LIVSAELSKKKILTLTVSLSDIRVSRIVLVGFDRTNNEQIVVTRGDNSNQSYMGLDFPVKFENYVGKVISVTRLP
jgi:hypothetical protein